MKPKTIYDYPVYYDILFGWDRSKEAGFYHAAFERHGVRAGDRILEVACGTGQVARRLARRGWRVTGLDLKPGMLAFLQESAAREGLPIETLCSDMTTLSSEAKFGAAYNPMSSFRLLQTDDDAETHLRAMAAVLEPGGIYVLDMEFHDETQEPARNAGEAWSMTRDKVTVRAQEDTVHVSDDGVERVLPWSSDKHLRDYSSASFAERVGAITELRIEAWHPERQGPSGISEFDLERTTEAPAAGRTMVILRRL